MIPVPTRKKVLQRLAQGPAQFHEFAVSKNYKSKSRVTARAILTQLEQEGVVLMAYIGRYPYYLLNTSESIKGAQIMRIEESSVVSPCGCINWTGYVSAESGPVGRIIGYDTPVSVRRVLWEWRSGSLKTADVLKPTCENPACVNLEHMKKIRINSHRKGEVRPPATRMRMAQAMRKIRKLTAEDAAEIRASTDNLKTTAARYGVTTSNISFIRRGVTFKDYSAGHFSGLGSRS